MVGERAGIRISIGMSISDLKVPKKSAVADVLRRLDHVGDLRQCHLLKIGGIGHGHILAGDGG